MKELKILLNKINELGITSNKELSNYPLLYEAYQTALFYYITHIGLKSQSNINKINILQIEYGIDYNDIIMDSYLIMFEYKLNSFMGTDKFNIPYICTTLNNLIYDFLRKAAKAQKRLPTISLDEIITNNSINNTHEQTLYNFISTPNADPAIIYENTLGTDKTPSEQLERLRIAKLTDLKYTISSYDNNLDKLYCAIAKDTRRLKPAAMALELINNSLLTALDGHITTLCKVLHVNTNEVLPSYPQLKATGLNAIITKYKNNEIDEATALKMLSDKISNISNRMHSSSSKK